MNADDTAGAAVDVDRLLFLVQNNPAIFNSTLKEHHNVDVISKIWTEIGKELNVQVSKIVLGTGVLSIIFYIIWSIWKLIRHCLSVKSIHGDTSPDAVIVNEDAVKELIDYESERLLTAPSTSRTPIAGDGCRIRRPPTPKKPRRTLRNSDGQICNLKNYMKESDESIELEAMRRTQNVNEDCNHVHVMPTVIVKTNDTISITSSELDYMNVSSSGISLPTDASLDSSAAEKEKNDLNLETAATNDNVQDKIANRIAELVETVNNFSSETESLFLEAYEDLSYIDDDDYLDSFGEDYLADADREESPTSLKNPPKTIDSRERSATN